MHDDYLWDPDGPADPSVVALERTLAPLRYEDEPLRLPLQEPVARPRPWRWALPVGAAAAAVALVLVLTPKESASVVVTVLPEVPTPEPPPVEVVARPAEVPEVPEVVQPEPAPAPVVKPPRAKRERPAEPSKPSKPKPAAEPDAAGPQVDCILGPLKCGRRVDPTLPATLTPTHIREGVAAVKEKAKACGPRHGAAAGTKVKVKFAVSGETGRVIDAVAQPPFTGTPLGTCVAAALAEAQFPKFRKERLGAVYPIMVDGS